MTNENASDVGEDSEALLRLLHEEIEAETGEDLDEESHDAARDQEQIEDLMKLEAFATSPLAAEAVDRVIPPAEISFESRQRMITSVRQALAERRLERGLLPVLLKAIRTRGHLSLVEVADRGQLAPVLLESLETGEVRVDVELASDTTVKWIRAVGAEPAVALPALRRSLEIAATSAEEPLAAGLGGARARAIEQYIEDVEAALQSEADRPS